VVSADHALRLKHARRRKQPTSHIEEPSHPTLFDPPENREC
jgi:hypothetical protein